MEAKTEKQYLMTCDCIDRMLRELEVSLVIKLGPCLSSQ